MKKKISMLLGVLLLLFSMGCGMEQTDPMTTIYSDETQLSNPYSKFDIGEIEQEIDGQSVNGKFEDMEGMVMLWTYDIEKETALELRYFLKVTQGRAKLVWVEPDGTVSTLMEFTKQNTMSDYAVVPLSLKKGLSRLKLVGTEDAVVEFDIHISEGEFISIK